MLIGVDGRELAGERTGVGRYLSELLREWAGSEAADRHRFVLYAPEPLELGAGGEGGIPGLDLDLRVVKGWSGTLWEQLSLPSAVEADRPDVFFSPGYTAPLLLRRPLVLTIHDLSYWARPEWFRRREGLRRRWITRLAARRARRVLTISRFTAGEIERWLGIDAARILVTPLAVRQQASAAAADADGAGPPLVLFLGSRFNRRRLPELIRAFALLAADRPEARLEIVGRDLSYPPQDLQAVARREGVEGRVGIHDWVAEETLEGFFSTARAFAFLSEYEGFALTPLEALARGVPVVLGDTPVAREIYGDAALYAPVGDPRTAAERLRTLLEDDRVRGRQLERGRALLERFSWQRTAAATMTALEAAAKESRGPSD